ncbi:MAG: EamA family transporter [Bacteroidetes bacterium]|nr:EamA family transporter [Bacteroidota bacterium]
MKKGNLLAYLAWLSTCIVWGTTYLAIRIGVGDLPPWLFAGFRWMAAGTVLISVLLFMKFKLPRLNEIKHLAVVGIALIGVANGLVVYAEQWIPSGLAALIVTTLPFWVVGIELALPLGNRISLTTIFGVLLGLVGTGLIFRNEFEKLFDPDYLTGVIAILGAIIVWAAGSLYSKSRKFEVHPLMGASIQMIIAGALQTIFGLLLGEYDSFIFTQSSLLAFLYLLFVGSLMGYASYIYALAHLPVSFATTYAYVNPVIALFLGWLVLGEELNLTIGIATVIILVGVFVVKRGSRAIELKKP